MQFTSNEGVSNDAPIHECESEIDHYTRHYVPYSLRRVCGFFNVPQIYYMCKGLWDGAYGLSSLSEKTRKSNHLQMLLQRQHFLLSYLKILSVGPARVWTYGLPLSRPALIPLNPIELTWGRLLVFWSKTVTASHSARLAGTFLRSDVSALFLCTLRSFQLNLIADDCCWLTKRQW